MRRARIQPVGEPDDAACARAFDRMVLRKFVLASAMVVAPIAIALAVAWSVHHSHAVHLRYIVAFSKMGEAAARFEAEAAHLLVSPEDAGERDAARAAFVELLTLYGALRAADPDGDEITERDDAEADAALRRLAAEYDVSPLDAAEEMRLAGHAMPAALGALWELEEAEGTKTAEASPRLEGLIGAMAKAGGVIASGTGPFGAQDVAALRAYDEIASGPARALLDEVGALLDAKARRMATIPAALSAMVVAIAAVGLAAAYVAVVRPLKATIRGAQQALRAEAARARCAEQAKSEFLATISHELRTPMNGVLGMTELLSGTEMTSRQRMFVDIIGSSAHALLGLINEILDFSRMEAGGVTLRPAPFDLARLAAEPAELVSKAAEAKNLVLTTRVAPGAPAMMVGDFDRLRQIAVNMLGNAVKFTEIGEIAMEVSAEPGRGENRPLLRVAVRDTGIGVAADKIDGLFERFSQADSSSTRAKTGAGLGLAICKGLVELMGGEIGATSRPGGGSTFWFSVPLEAAPARPEERVAEEGARAPLLAAS